MPVQLVNKMFLSIILSLFLEFTFTILPPFPMDFLFLPWFLMEGSGVPWGGTSTPSVRGWGGYVHCFKTERYGVQNIVSEKYVDKNIGESQVKDGVGPSTS